MTLTREVGRQLMCHVCMLHGLVHVPVADDQRNKNGNRFSIVLKVVPPADNDDDSHHLAPSDIGHESDDLEELFQDSPVVEIENEDFEAFDNPAQEPGTPLADGAPSEDEATPKSEGLNGGYSNATGLSTHLRNSDPQHVFMAQIRALNDLADHCNFMDPSVVGCGGSFELLFTRF